MSQPRPILIAGEWRQAQFSGTFRAENPATGQPLSDEYPISTWADCDAALSAATEAANILRDTSAEQRAEFLRGYAGRIESRASELVEIANLETGLPKSPRLAAVELPRTTNQLRLAADAAVEGSWTQPTIDTKANIRSQFAPIGPVLVIGPNNFPFAFNGISGSDFAAAVAGGNPLIAKAHPSHPATTRLLAEEAAAAARDAGLPVGTVQLLYHMKNEDGLRLVADARIGATGFTGSRRGGMALKGAADAAGKLIYLEMSSINPLIILPGALAQRGEKIAEEFASSALMGNGQFCTSPGLVLVLDGEAAEKFIANVRARFEAATPGTLLSGTVLRSLIQAVETLQAAGAQRLTGGQAEPGPAYRFKNTLLRASAQQFCSTPDQLQTEAFGNASLIVTARNAQEAMSVLDHFEGNLTGSIYSATDGADESLYNQIAARLRPRVGRLLNDKMPTGVAVSPAMNHGGPYPATGHPGFTAVGIPASLRRFALLQCYDNVRMSRLPLTLQDKNHNGKTWRLIDGSWTQADITA
ncbi:MAG: aldehyde dehydrogenase (NADP(+)) [Planctomycetota bacterium]|nr:aldehyde dehydrogenase (NADP(+)) [Planctomycetota bacterium]